MGLMRSSEQFEKLNAQQRQSLDWTRSIAVRANAGSGKTSVLIERLVQILHSDVTRGGRELRLQQIVAITFTRKAAAQLRERFRQALIRCEQDSPADEQSYWRDRIEEIPNCPISTIDALVHRMLRSAIAEGMITDLDPNFGVLQGIERDELIDQAIVRTEQGISTTASATRDAWESWLTTQGRREMTEALRILLNSPFRPGDCRRAIQTVKNRLSELLGCMNLKSLADPIGALERESASFQSSIAEVMRELAGLPPKEQDLNSVKQMRQSLAQIAAEEDALAVSTLTKLRRTLLTAEGTAKKQGLVTKGNPKSPKLDALQQRWQPLLANWNFKPDDDNWQLVEELVRLFEEAHRHFRDLCAEENRFDFDYLAGRVIETLDRDQAQRLSGHFRFILVDEFQDTNELHWRLIARLAGEDPSQPVGSAKLMIVGDPQQSIYRFRKADPTVFDRVQELIRRGNRESGRHQCATAYEQHEGAEDNHASEDERAGLMRLRKNYRTSHSQPLKWIDKLSNQAFGSMDFQYQPLEAGLQDSPNAEFIYVFPRSREQSPEGNADDEESAGESINSDQIQLVAGELRRQHNDCGFAWKDMAVLVRSRTTLLTNLEEAFRRQAIPFQVVGGIGFWQRQEVRDMVSLARCLANLADEMSLFAVLRGPLCGLDDSEILFLSTLGSDRIVQGLRLFDLLDDQLILRDGISPDDADWADTKLQEEELPIELLRGSFAKLDPVRKSFLRTAAGRLRESGIWRQRVDRMPHADLMRLALDESEAWQIYASETNGSRCVANLRQVLEQVRDLEASRPFALSDLARHLTRLVDEATREEQAAIEPAGGDAVQVMTVHAAKGLEFPVVAVLGLERKFPADHSPVWLLDRHQHLRKGVAPEFAAGIHGLPIISFRDPEMPLRKIQPLLHQAVTAMEREQSRMEEARIFHVAITRAQKVLILAGAPESAGRNCWQSWVQDALGLPDEICESTWPHPSGEMPPVRIVRTAQAAAGRAALPAVGNTLVDIAAIAESPRTRMIAATSLFQMLSDFEADAEKWRLRYLHQVRSRVHGVPDDLLNGSPAADRDNVGSLIGTLVHRALEMADLLPNDLNQQRQWLEAWALGLSASRREGIADAAEEFPPSNRVATIIAKEANEILQTIQTAATGDGTNAFRGLLSAPGDAEVEFALAVGLWRIIGRFDRLIYAANGRLEVVDWKTDSDPPDEIARKYRNQMQLYALALLERDSAGESMDQVLVHLAMTAHVQVRTLHFRRTELDEFQRDLERRLLRLDEYVVRSNK